MQDENAAVDGANRMLTPPETVPLEQTTVIVASLNDADSLDKAYWAAQSLQDRLRALEIMRQFVYGYDPLTDRVERVVKVIKRPLR
jgi:hypothetical protein